jgi:hypothetical protein
VDKRITNVIAVTVTAAWLISFLMDIVVKSYEPPVSVHALMMMVAGAAFAEGVVKKNGNETKHE